MIEPLIIEAPVVLLLAIENPSVPLVIEPHIIEEPVYNLSLWRHRLRHCSA